MRIAGSLAELARWDWRGFCFLPISDMSWRRRTGISEDRVLSSLMAALLPTVRSDLTTIDRDHFSASRRAGSIASTRRSASWPVSGSEYWTGGVEWCRGCSVPRYILVYSAVSVRSYRIFVLNSGFCLNFITSCIWYEVNTAGRKS